MIKFILKFFIASSLIAALLISGAAVYMKLHGKSLVESALSNMIGLDVKYKSASVDIDKGSVSLAGVTVADRALTGNYILKIDKLNLWLDKVRLIKERALVIERAQLEGAALNIERARNGSFNIRFTRRSGPGSKNSAFDILSRIKELTVTNSKLRFSDSRITRRTVIAIFDGINLQYRSLGAEGNVIHANFSAEARVPSGRYPGGTLTLGAGMAIYRDRVNLNARIDAHSADLAFFCPYINKYTPFIFRGGLFSSATDLRIYNNHIYSPTTVIFHAIDMNVKPYTQDSQFLEANLGKLVPYLESRSGDLIFDFYLTGSPGNITAGVGPRVRNAIGMATQAEMMKLFGQLQRLQY